MAKMFSQPHKIEFSLPEWINEYSLTYQTTDDLKERMKFVIQAAKINVEEKTGGPFAAAIFEIETGKLVSLGVNLVMTQGLSILHAEVVAISVAQRKLGGYDLGAKSLPRHELLTSTEPCAMCLGAIPWSGVKKMVTAAFDQDARNIGFDEGQKPIDWVAALNERNIEVIRNIERDEAIKVMQLYSGSDNHIYNPREG